MKSKKAQALPMNTIVIAIIVLVVLIIILVFFLGGISSIAQKIRDLFTGATAGTDKQTALQFCQEYCDQGRYSMWCTKTFKIDTDGDGIADKDPDTKQYIKFYCGTPAKIINPNEPMDSLGLSCPEASEECSGTVPS